MSKQKGPNLLDMIERERHNYSASISNQDPTWTQDQPQPNRSVAKMFVIMLGIHILVIAGLIMYDFATGTQKQPVTVQKTNLDPASSQGVTKSEGPPPDSANTVTPDPRNDTPGISSTPPAAAPLPASPDTPPLPYVTQPAPAASSVNTAPTSGMPVLSPGSSRVDLEPVTPSTLAVTLPPSSSSRTISQPSIDLPPPPPATTVPPKASPAKTEPAKTETVKTEPKKAEPKKAVASAPPAPKKPEVKKPAATTSAKPPAAPAKMRASSHTVARGDTLGGIARRYGVSVSSLVRANKLKDANTVILGSKLVIPKN